MQSLIVANEETLANSSFYVHLRFITDRCVAARVDARERPEWPPHPGRFYMALVAAHAETDGPADEKLAERGALEWLAQLPAPRIHAVEIAERSFVACYVPVNDAIQANTSMLQSAPGMPRSRQARAFPTAIPQRCTSSDHETPDVTYEWPVTANGLEHRIALERLCRQVVRVGHSSSLVMAWTDGDKRFAVGQRWEPSAEFADWSCRIAVAGELDRLIAACGAERIELFGNLKHEIESTTGKAQTAAKKRFAEAFGEPYRASLRPPEPTPATLGVWQGYQRAPTAPDPLRQVKHNAHFAGELLILTLYDGPTVDVERTLWLTQGLRAALLAAHGQTPIPTWLSGHAPDGSPTAEPHAAFLALPFVGYPHADGHVMGLALALPVGVPVHERGRWLGPLLVHPQTGDWADGRIRVWWDREAEWTFQLEDRPSPPLILRNQTWTRPSATWASVTPVVLDRYPKTPREDRQTWQAEVEEIVRLAVTRAGFSDLDVVCIGSTAWHTGVPRAWGKTRRLRGHGLEPATAPLGDGFPPLPGRPSRPEKPQVHVCLRFKQPVAGPVLLGAGRFLGYGLCMPLG